jgi:hypothetical protein
MEDEYFVERGLELSRQTLIKITQQGNFAVGGEQQVRRHGQFIFGQLVEH